MFKILIAFHTVDVPFEVMGVVVEFVESKVL